MIKIICKECGETISVPKLCNKTGRIPRETKNRKLYNLDILCPGCKRVLIKGKEVPSEIIKLGEKLDREAERRRPFSL